ncbi:hypothetical protein CPB86DRAFT_796427 [Serendipita vermifera]|nr:hypothetical protein CPB86DRAFT_796427 [Serendipita vermifera]
MLEPAVQRTPVEIWSMILRHAVATPMLPFTDAARDHLGTNIVQNMLLFPQDCELYRKSAAINTTTKNLRLVCRTWADILEDVHQRCIFASDRGILNPYSDAKILHGAERVQITEDFIMCNCCFAGGGKECLLQQEYDLYGEYDVDWLEQLENATLQHLFGQVRILSIDNWRFDIKKLIGMMPKLRALRLIQTERCATQSIPSLIPQSFHLTHLHLAQLLWQDFCKHFQVRSTCLQPLLYLGLDFICKQSWRAQPESTTLPRIEWDYPNLVNLYIRGTLPYEAKEEFDQFLRQCGRNVTGFVNRCSFYKRGERIGPEGIPPEDRFPRLALYGTLFKSIIPFFSPNSQSDHSPSDKLSLSRSFLLCEFDTAFSSESEWLAEGLVKLMPEWGFTGIILDMDWGTFGNFKVYSSWFRKFFSVITTSNLLFSDNKGIDVRDMRCARFWDS